MGSITAYTTNSGRRYRVRYRKPDRTQTDKRGFKTKRDAEIFLASVEVAKVTGRYIDPGRSRVTVGEWMAIWLASRSDLRRSTFDRVEGAIRNHIVPEFGPVPIAELSRLMCQQFAAKMNVTHKPGSVRTVINVLSGALQLAVDDGRLAANPAHRLKLPRQMKRRKKFLTHQQVAALAAAVDAKPNGEGFGLLVFVLSYCGLRWGELAGLRVRDLDFTRRRLNVRETMVEVDGYFEVAPPKNYEERSIPVPEFIMDRLAEHIRVKALDDHVFVSSRNGSVMRNRTFRRYWFDEAAEAIGIPGLTPHELRHTCASLAVSVGANVKAVQLMLGHASAAITLDVYADLFEDDLDGVGEALNTAAFASSIFRNTELSQVVERQPRAGGFVNESLVAPGFNPTQEYAERMTSLFIDVYSSDSYEFAFATFAAEGESEVPKKGDFFTVLPKIDLERLADQRLCGAVDQVDWSPELGAFVVAVRVDATDEELEPSAEVKGWRRHRKAQSAPAEPLLDQKPSGDDQR